MKVSDNKDLKNQNGDEPSDIPSDRLKKPAKTSGKQKAIRQNGHNTTAKDPKLGDRHTTR